MRYSSLKVVTSTMLFGTLIGPFFGSVAQAQSSVTLYGVIDEGLNFTTNAGGKRGYAMVSGDTAASVWGLKGTEDLGGGNSAIFKLENSFYANNGTYANGGREFGREAWVGLSSTRYGTLTMGRQYDPMIDMWSAFTGAGNLIGDLAAHPFDNDNSDYDYRINNSVKYLSPSFSGLQFEALYGFSNATDFAANRTYGAGVTYTMGGFSSAVSYLKEHNGGSSVNGSASSDDTVFVSSSQQNIAAAVKWTFANNANIAFAYSHVDVYDPTSNLYVSDIGTQTWNAWKFDNFDLNGQYYFHPDFWIAADYTFTHAKWDGTSSSSSQNWHHVALMLDYDFSKRTSVYVQGAYEHTNGSTGTGLDYASIIGSSATSSSRNQMVYRVALMHRF
ncbi:MAG: porin [Janthinobacterium lividum]